VVASRRCGLGERQLVVGWLGWQEWAVVSDAAPLRRVAEIPGISVSAHLGVLGGDGLTPWVGMTELGRPHPGETVVVSAAAGGVGSVAGQIAKRRGARVVGIAGGSEKCALLLERLGFDAAVDRRTADWREQLAAATPDGIAVDLRTSAETSWTRCSRG
jgi:NADPH-dependent curcumin reductase CurA